MTLCLFVSFLIPRSLTIGRLGVVIASRFSRLIRLKTASTGRAIYDAGAEKITVNPAIASTYLTMAVLWLAQLSMRRMWFSLQFSSSSSSYLLRLIKKDATVTSLFGPSRNL